MGKIALPEGFTLLTVSSSNSLVIKRKILDDELITDLEDVLTKLLITGCKPIVEIDYVSITADEAVYQFIRRLVETKEKFDVSIYYDLGTN